MSAESETSRGQHSRPRPAPQPGAAFALGWLIAQLYGSLSQWDVQESPDYLPAVSELARPERIRVAYAQLKLLADPFGDFGIDQAKTSYAAHPDSLKPTVRQVHYQILEALAGDAQQLSAYQLGRALSDTCWLPTQGADVSLFAQQFDRQRLAILRSWMAQAGAALPAQSAAVATRSLQNWQDWVDVNVSLLEDQGNWMNNKPLVVQALGNQERAWRALLTSPPPAGGSQPSVNAWIHAGESVLRTAKTLARKVLLRFWYIVVIVLAATGGLLYLAVNNLHGASKFWASFVTVAGALGVSGTTLRSAGQSAAQGVEQEVWNAATLDGRAWEVTWLPTLTPRLRDRYRLYRRGVAPPQMKKGIESLVVIPEKTPPVGAGQVQAGAGGVLMVEIDHVVVLALENRSFDHLLGYLDHPDPAFDGVRRGGPYNNPGWNGAGTLPVTSNAKTVLPVCPDHSHDAAMEQLGLSTAPHGTVPTNQGFVTSYERICRGLSPARFAGLIGPLVNWWTTRNPPPAPILGRGPLVMDCQDPSHVPVLAGLARQFAVCTRWFCSVPGETWPNRNFMHAATSDGETDTDPRLYTNKTIFELLEEHGKSWHIYYDDTPQVWAFVNLWNDPARTGNWYEFPAFDQHVRAGTLPTYSFIEPNHRPPVHTIEHDPVVGTPDVSDSQHPGNNLVNNSNFDAAPPSQPGDFSRAEALIASVYQSLRANPDVFNRTVLLITYDEHGGLYDHVPPPTGVPNPGIDASLLRRIFRAIYRRKAATFDFSVLGPRVPAVVVSPYVEPGTINAEPRDHASIPSTLRALFAPTARPLTSRDDWATPFHSVVSRTTARTDLPDLSNHVRAAASAPPEATVGPAAAPPEQYQPFVSLADAVQRRLGAAGVPEALAVPGTPPYERTAHTAVAFKAEAERCRKAQPDSPH